MLWRHVMTSNNSTVNGRKPKLVAMDGACDCHMHIYESRFPVASTAVSPPPEAPLAAYRNVRQQLGLTRAVIVQPSAYGTDNSCTMEAVKALGKDARGVVVVDTTVTDAALVQLTDAGARGIRFHMLPGGALPWDILEEMAARVDTFGWHVQLQMDGRFLSERESVLK